MLSWLFGKKEEPSIGLKESNDQIRAQLKKMGDDGCAIRHVVHYAYPEKGADLSARESMFKELRAQGFEVSDAVNDNGVVLEQHRSVHGADFDALTVELENWFRERGWDYDGWECAVMQETA